MRNGTYRPLSRPIFIYVEALKALDRPEVEAFVEFYLDQGVGAGRARSATSR